MSLKTNKTILSRVRVSKRGKVLSMGTGHGHFNAKASRVKQLRNKRQSEMNISKKTKQRFKLN